MKVFSYSKWQYELEKDWAYIYGYQEAKPKSDDVMECSTCGDEMGIGYIIADTEDEVTNLINTDRGQQCSACLAMFLSTTNHSVTPPTVSRESN